jgi:hypothetical protein
MQAVKVLRLETGMASHTAWLYMKTRDSNAQGPFADYRPDPLSVFMGRPL